MNTRKLVKILYGFDINSKNNHYDKFEYRNCIDFQGILDYKTKYFDSNYTTHTEKYDNELINNVKIFIYEKNNLINENVLIDDNKRIYINNSGCKDYLNIFNTIERFFIKYEKTLVFFIGLISGGGIIGIITLFKFLF